MNVVPTIVASLAPAKGRMTVDPLTGVVTRDDRGAVPSAPDAAALEVALTFADAWGSGVTAISAGGALAEVTLRAALAAGVTRAVHVDIDDAAEPVVVAAALAEVVVGADGGANGEGSNVFVVTGVHGTDVASAAVPACLAHHLSAEQALGLVAIEPSEPGRCTATRRLDRGQRERLAVRVPAVVSVEGSVATLRRAPLGALFGVADAVIERVRPSSAVTATVGSGGIARPWRPRTHVVAGPAGDSALARISDLTGVAGPAKASRTVEVDPSRAAELILDELGAHGYGPRATPG